MVAILFYTYVCTGLCSRHNNFDVYRSEDWGVKYLVSLIAKNKILIFTGRNIGSRNDFCIFNRQLLTVIVMWHFALLSTSQTVSTGMYNLGKYRAPKGLTSHSSSIAGDQQKGELEDRCSTLHVFVCSSVFEVAHIDNCRPEAWIANSCLS